jgi:N-acylneuraminate cytidylyltransferase
MPDKFEQILAIIPARGGSKSIPRKNIRPLAGKPLVAYSIESSLNASLIDRTVVSTDDEEIARVATQYGAEVVMRPAAMATDKAITELAMVHAVEQLEKGGWPVNLVVLLQPTTPFRPADLIDVCITKLLDEEADSLLTVCPAHLFFWERENGEVRAHYDYKHRPMRQDMKPMYEENGNVYVTRREILMSHDNRLGGRIEMYVMEREDSMDINTPFDFWLAERMMEYRGQVDERN